jgi:hypothetical protein
VKETTSVRTQVTFDLPPGQVWDRLMFYEQIEERPPLALRLLLPVPTGTEGRKSSVGDEARCLYDRGYLVKRITRIEPGRHYGFDVVEQRLAIRGGIRLAGGSYTLRETPGGGTEVTLTTRYLGATRPRWMWKPIEAAICHRLHRFILGAMERSAPTQAGQETAA